MTDVIDRQTTQKQDMERPPLFLTTYFAGQAEPRPTVRIAERRGNVIELEFVREKQQKPMATRRCRWRNGWWDAAILLLFIASIAECAFALMGY